MAKQVDDIKTESIVTGNNDPSVEIKRCMNSMELSEPPQTNTSGASLLMSRRFSSSVSLRKSGYAPAMKQVSFYGEYYWPQSIGRNR